VGDDDYRVDQEAIIVVLVEQQAERVTRHAQVQAPERRGVLVARPYERRTPGTPSRAPRGTCGTAVPMVCPSRCTRSAVSHLSSLLRGAAGSLGRWPRRVAAIDRSVKNGVLAVLAPRVARARKAKVADVSAAT
jgi:hypothetical protein